MNPSEALLWAAATGFAVFLSLFKIGKLALAIGAVDFPRQRGFHQQPVPRAGGMAIAPVVLISATAYLLAVPGGPWQKFVPYGVGAILIAAVSLRDDIREVGVGFRSLIQSLSCILVIMGCGYWQEFWIPGAGLVDIGGAGAIVTFLWLFGLTNAYNFMDGIDGIASSQAVIAGAGWFLALAPAHPGLPALLAALLAGTSLGFLFHNRPPAKLFLGDSGAAFLGFSFGCLGLIADSENPKMPILAGFMVLPFVLDSFLTFLIRLTRGENVLKPHQAHLYQRLVLTGYSHLRVTLTYAALSTASVAVILLWFWGELRNGPVIFSTVVLCMVLFWGFVATREKARAQARQADEQAKNGAEPKS